MAEFLESLGRVFGTRQGSARSTAALLNNPSCERRAVLDAARVNVVKVAKQVGAPAPFGQSPFAIGQGNRFEAKIKDNGYAGLIAAINDLLGIFDGIAEFKTDNLDDINVHDVKKRAERTAEILEAIARGDKDAPHVVDHGITTLDVGGNLVYLEQDALAFRDGELLRICEIKGFPIIDGTASPAKVGAAARQTAVYVASIQDTLAARGFDPALVSSEVVLVCPKNFGITPIAVKVDVTREVRALRRQLRRRESIVDVVARIEADAIAAGSDLSSLVAVAEATKIGSAARKAATLQLIGALPYRYVPECMTQCDLARHCRGCSEAADDPTRLGGEAATLLAGVGTIAEAIALADGATPKPGQEELAEMLRSAERAMDDVYGTAP